MVKDEELRSLLRKRGYRILELYYDSYSDKKRDRLYEEIKIGAPEVPSNRTRFTLLLEGGKLLVCIEGGTDRLQRKNTLCLPAIP